MQAELMQVELWLQVAPALEAGDGHRDEAAIALPSEAVWQTYFEQWLQRLSPQQSSPQSYEISLVLTTDAEIQTLNATYRQVDAPTDVLAFAALEGEGIFYAPLVNRPIPLGDIIISVETATQQALEQGHSLSLEVIWLAAHGLLHLLGWDHPTAIALEQMLNQQEQMLRWVGLESPAWSAQALGYPS